MNQESSRYAHPIISREDLLALLLGHKRTMSFAAIAKAVGYHKVSQKQALRKRLDAMVRDQQCSIDRRGRYKPGQLLPCQTGVFLGVEQGEGRVRVDAQTLYGLPGYQCVALLPGDRVQIRPLKRGRFTDQAVLVEVLERACANRVGVLVKAMNQWWMQEQGRHAMRVALKADPEHRVGQHVKVKITRYPSAKQPAMGEVIERLAPDNPLAIRVELALSQHGIPHIWPDDLEAQLSHFTTPSFERDGAHRTDLRAKPFVTIDGDSAQDFDDAVYAERTRDGGYRIWVAIADVAHYVEEGSLLDDEARMRGNSTYFPNHVVPMLPDRLSNDLCSLRPHVDRLVVVAQMELNAQGVLQSSDFYRAIIHSFARLTYGQVQAMMDGQAVVLKGWEQAYEALVGAHYVLEKRRQDRGCLHFSMHDPHISFDRFGHVDDIVASTSSTSHVLIENLMLLANESVAHFLSKNKSKESVFRLHEGPSAEKWEQAYPFLRQLGLQVPNHHEGITPHDYQAWLQGSADLDTEDMVHRTLLRTMQQAVYTTQSGQHFGLSYDIYTHFTSPIRRYPDLLVHRALLRQLGLLAPAKQAPDLKALCAHCSMTERRSEMAEREVRKALICHFMQEKIGEHFMATVRSVTSFGLFVQVDDLGVEGLIHITRLPSDYYVFDDTEYALQGRSTQRRFAMGDRVNVTLDQVDVEQGRIDFRLQASSS